MSNTLTEFTAKITGDYQNIFQTAEKFIIYIYWDK